MKNRFTIKLYNDLSFWKPVRSFYEELCTLVDFPVKERLELADAFYELFENAVVHAYEGEDGEIKITFEIFENGMKIDVHDFGIPIDPKIVQSVPLNLKEKQKGLNRVYQLVDGLKFHNLGLKGKKFSILKLLPVQLRLKNESGFYSDIGDDFDKDAKEILRERLQVRTFKEGDEVWIPKLIYKNYGYTYFKDTFYYPEKILQKERDGQILSVVAQVDQKVVGHFALVRVPNSNIAEIGIAVVDPAFKGMGIMKEMFALLLQKAQEIGLDALFGEAITFHPYSQRANARYGFKTSALLLGEVHHMVKLKDHKYPFSQNRGAVAVEYKIFKKYQPALSIPNRYRDIIQKTYALQNIAFTTTDPQQSAKNRITIEPNDTFKIATIVIDTVAKEFKKTLQRAFEDAIALHPDMIYADINLHKCTNIDAVVDELRSFGFFYAGVLFLRRRDCDYLRMQFEASKNIEEQNIVCYSNFCKELHHYILHDKDTIYKQLS
ncbi:GNAT family N-acetyltransferase [Nitratiruptor sp. YY09-18]|uniref:GNAT family N-acetyltransferase n=1 Tax=Nitratiruptor sp. YY09-18 TaxID=2724901 RepID=UPI001916C38B|nr:GNAT family N-acetyltransferase [Nitratiruptor sp. YY09-18]BCD67765.1 hypothetical protein NitYY0918_C0672 [Nitratiruptor sp. YY09-18]